MSYMQFSAALLGCTFVKGMKLWYDFILCHPEHWFKNWDDF
jgi:hypothetical protein